MSLIGSEAFLKGTARTFSWSEKEQGDEIHDHIGYYGKFLKELITDKYRPGVDFYYGEAGRVGIVEYLVADLPDNVIQPTIVLRSKENKDIMFATRTEDLIFLNPTIRGVDSIYKRNSLTNTNKDFYTIRYNFIESDTDDTRFGELYYVQDSNGDWKVRVQKILNTLDNIFSYYASDYISYSSYCGTGKRGNRIVNKKLRLGYKITTFNSFDEIPANILEGIVKYSNSFYVAMGRDIDSCYKCSCLLGKRFYAYMNHFSERVVCRDCISTTRSTCDFCQRHRRTQYFLGDVFSEGHLSELRQMILDTGANDVCSECIRWMYLNCSRCRDIKYINIKLAYNGGEEYLDNGFRILRDKYNNYNDSMYCNTCYKAGLDESLKNPVNGLGSIQDYYPYTAKKVKIDRYISVESEVITYYDDEDDEPAEQVLTPQNWRAVNDGSLSGGGVEFKNIRPIRGDSILQNLNNLQNSSCDQDFYIDNSCGIHVHMDARDFNWQELRNLIVIMNTIEPSIMNSMPAHRRLNRFCKSIDDDFGQPLVNSHVYDKINSLEELVDFSYRDLSKVDPDENRYNSSRYRGMNLHSRFYHGTIEFRYHEGEIYSDPIIDWVRFCNRIMIAAKSLDGHTDKWKRIKSMILSDNADGLDVIKNIGGRSSLSYIEERIKRFSK